MATHVVIVSPPNAAPGVEQGADTIQANHGLPDNFIKCPSICCAFRFDYMDWPACFGCKGADQTCCTEGEFYAYKFVNKNDDNICCVFESGQYDCTEFEYRCKTYRQCFCIEWVCGCPLEESLLSTGDMLHNVTSTDGTENILDAVPCNAFCCSITALYCSFPSCIGCNSRGECLCFKNQSTTCKPMCWDTDKHNPRACCMVAKKNLVCYNYPRTCVKCMDQTCCLDSRCALPCDKDVPCMYTMLPFCVCCVDWQCKCACCMSVGQLTNQTHAPTTQGQVQMQQQQQQHVVVLAVQNPTTPPAQVVYVQPTAPPAGVVMDSSNKM